MLPGPLSGENNTSVRQEPSSQPAVGAPLVSRALCCNHTCLEAWEPCRFAGAGARPGRGVAFPAPLIVLPAHQESQDQGRGRSTGDSRTASGATENSTGPWHCRPGQGATPQALHFPRLHPSPRRVPPSCQFLPSKKPVRIRGAPPCPLAPAAEGPPARGPEGETRNTCFAGGDRAVRLALWHSRSGCWEAATPREQRLQSRLLHFRPS